MNPDRQGDAAFVVDGLRQLVHGLRATAHVVERDFGLSGAQLFVLRELAVEPHISIRRLSERTLTDASSASVVVARLVKRGLVARGSDPNDARRSVLSVSKRGAALLARAPQPYQAKLFEALHGLPRARLRQLRLGFAALLSLRAGTGGVAPLFFEQGARQKSRGKRRAKIN